MRRKFWGLEWRVLPGTVVYSLSNFQCITGTEVDLEDFEKNTAYALYENFIVAGAADQYRLQVSGYNGTAGDAMSYNLGARFTTKDRDNNNHGNNCALLYKGPWWHKHCSWTNLNAKYYFTQNVGDYGGVTWYQWKSNWYSMKTVNMKVRRK